MNPVVGTALVVVPLAVAASLSPAEAQQTFYCPSCPIESKVPSATTPNQFTYTLKCTDDQNGVASSNAVAEITVTAPDDANARTRAWNSPTIDQVMVGLEAAAYACAVR